MRFRMRTREHGQLQRAADAMSECSSIAKALEESEHQNEVIANALTSLREEKASLKAA